MTRSTATRAMLSGRAVHTLTPDNTRTLCRRSAAGMLNLTRLDVWTRIGMEASSAGPCMRCLHAEYPHEV
jgi:hypothetical protein